MMYAPGALWTAAHHEIPLLTVMHNNKGYHQEVMHVQRLSNRRNRVANNGKDFGPIGTRIENPDIDYAHAREVDGLVGGRARSPIRRISARRSSGRSRWSRRASRR